MRIKRNYILLITLLAGLITVLSNPDITNGQTVKIDFEKLQLSVLTKSLEVTNQFNDKGINFTNATAVDSLAKPEFPHSGKQVIESCFGYEFCSVPIGMTFNQPQKRIRVWVGFDYPGRYRLYLRAFDKNNKQIVATQIVKEPLILITGITPAGILRSSLNYKMFLLEVNAKSNAIVRAEVGLITPNGVVGTLSISVDDVEFERIK